MTAAASLITANCQFSSVVCNTTNTTTVQRLFIWANSGEPASELSETLTQYISLIVLNFLTSTPNLPSQASQSTSRD